jgi:hypothetical protein
VASNTEYSAIGPEPVVVYVSVVADGTVTVKVPLKFASIPAIVTDEPVMMPWREANVIVRVVEERETFWIGCWLLIVVTAPVATSISRIRELSRTKSELVPDE